MDLNYIDWGYIMDTAIATVVGALITVAGSIIINYIGNRKGYKDIDSKIGTLDNTTLSGQHNKIAKDIEKSITDNTKEINNKFENKIGVLTNTTLSGQNQDIIRKVENISNFLERERELKNQKNALLNYDMQKINVSIDNLSGFADIMKNLSAENTTLKTKNCELINQNRKLQQENINLKNQLAKYQQPEHTNSFTQSM